MERSSLKVLVVGASGGSGRAATEALLAAGHEVTAFARHADRLAARSDRLRLVNGDAMNPWDVDAAVRGQDAVVVTLGEHGAAVALPSGVVQVPAPGVDVVDTVGAGDTFTGAVLAALSAHRVTDRTALAKLDAGWWRTALTYAAEAAAISCSRPGCDPPWRHELR